MASSFRPRSRLRTFVIRGFAALLPTLLTIFLLITGFNLLNQYLGEPVVAGLNKLFDPVEDPATGKLIPYIEPGSWWAVVATVALSVAACFVVGFILATFAGGRVYATIEKWIVELPVLKKIYPYAKQVTEFFFREKPMEWSAVVAVEYPRKGIWSLGFVTAKGLRELSAHTGTEMLSVYMPTSPVPFTGYVVAVAPDELVPLRMTVEEAIRWLVSAGVVLPGGGPYERPRLAPGDAVSDWTPKVDTASSATPRGG